MNITKFLKLVKTYQADIILALVVIFISVTAFNLGKISTFNKQKTPITITEPVNSKQLTGNGGEGTQNSKLAPST